jgi:hypothetical protein
MTLAASGEMSIGGTTATRSINLELSRAAGATSSLGEAALRTLAGVASGAISISNFYGKSNIAIAQSLQAYCASTDGTVAFAFNSNGSMYYYQAYGGSTDWATPNTAGIGPNYWVKITYLSGVALSGMTSGTLYQIAAEPYNPTAYYTVGVGAFQAGTGYVDIYSDAGGTTRVGGGTYSFEVINEGGPGA